MMPLNKLISGLFLLAWVTASSAGALLKPFQADSLQHITSDRKGEPFVLVLWSVDCPPCLKELAQLQQLRHQFSSQDLVLVATDDIHEADSVQKTINDFQLGQMDNWIFTGTIPERMRYAVDPNWYGELPRAYFYDRFHQRIAHSGSLKRTTLETWLKSAGMGLDVGVLR